MAERTRNAMISPVTSALDASVIGAASMTTPLPDAGRIDLVLPVLQIDYR